MRGRLHLGDILFSEAFLIHGGNKIIVYIKLGLDEP